MKHLFLASFFLLFFTESILGQDIVIKGDTAFWYELRTGYHDAFKLKDFTQQQDSFSFRFWNHRQVVEISKNDSSLSGDITSFVFYKKKRNRPIYGFWGFFNQFVKVHPIDTLVQKKRLDSTQLQNAFDVINHSGILELSSDNEIEGWQEGFDAVTYTIEHTNQNEYWFKNYWTPTAQDSLAQAVQVQQFINNLSDTVQLPETYQDFKETWRKQGCYNAFSVISSCYARQALGLGYSGMSQLPIGYTAGYYLNYIKNVKVETNFRVHHNLGFRNDNSNFSLEVSKSPIFIEAKGKPVKFDFINYQYQRRKLDFLDDNGIFQNHKLKYGLFTKTNTEFGLGVDYLQSSEGENIAPLAHFFQWFSKPKLSIYGRISYFNSDDIDYRVQISKSIDMRISTLSISLFYENFRTYNDIGLSVNVWL